MRSARIYGTIDIGNTFTKLAVFHISKENEKTIIDKKKLQHLKVDELRQWEKENSIEHIAYSASGKEHIEILDYLESHKRALLLTDKTPMPIKILYKTPETLGRDRIAAVLGAQAIIPHSNILVIDLGTCITYEWLTEKGEYLGGNISPGIHMRLEAMHTFTAKLPMVKWDENSTLIGNSTKTALLNGAVTGTICEIETFIGRTNKEFGNHTVVLTGGDAEKISLQLTEQHTIQQDLIHIGLCELIQYNNERK